LIRAFWQFAVAAFSAYTLLRDVFFVLFYVCSFALCYLSRRIKLFNSLL